MRSAAISITLLSLCLLLPAGCTDNADDADNPVLARVGDETLTLEQALREIPVSILSQDTLQALENYQSTWIDNQVVRQEALRIGLDRNEDLQEKVDRLRSQLLESTLREMIISRNSSETEVTRSEAQDYYEAHKESFVLDERHVRFRHLTTRTRVEAENARQDLLRGVTWPDVAEQYSINPQLQLRHSANFFPLSMAAADIPVMNQYLGRIGMMEISPVHDHGGFYHFVQLTDRKEEGDHPELDWLIDQITEWLRMEKIQRLLNSYIRNLYLQADANNEIERHNVNEIQFSQIQNRITSDSN